MSHPFEELRSNSFWFKTFSNWISIFLAWYWTLYNRPFVKFTL